ncbi:hypothetical protein ACH4FX_40530 [Streptomyces sp. NPDC018019]|uniref:hypothetical protein n=1 Tax=Streptomyces sp. NPDC018019 TaxID=3365030 RepID=UPI00378C4A32
MDVRELPAPRQAADRTVEPALDFETVAQSAHAVDRCPISCVVIGDHCVGTASNFVE